MHSYKSHCLELILVLQFVISWETTWHLSHYFKQYKGCNPKKKVIIDTWY